MVSSDVRMGDDSRESMMNGLLLLTGVSLSDNGPTRPHECPLQAASWTG